MKTMTLKEEYKYFCEHLSENITEIWFNNYEGYKQVRSENSFSDVRNTIVTTLNK